MAIEFCVELNDSVNIAHSLELFRRSGDDFIDRWDGERLVRAVYISNHAWVPFIARPLPRVNTPTFRVTVKDTRDMEVMKEAVATTFTLAPPEYSQLLERDLRLAALDAAFPGIRQIRQLDLYTALIRCISAQQVNLRWASITRRRLAEAFGRGYEIGGDIVYALDPERIASVDPAEIRALQFTTTKAVSIVATARAIIERADLALEQLRQLEDEQVIERLTEIRGIGRWSAEWVLARTLGRPRVVAGDLGVRKAVGLTYLSNASPSEAEVRAATTHWGESAGVAQAVLLHALGEGAIKLPTPARTGSRAASRA